MKPPPANVLELPLHVRAEMALKEAVEEAIEEHIRAGRPIYVWSDGRVVKVSPEELKALKGATST
jgi:hypothetical protein